MSRLRVAIVHYHLKRGGVTRVIESTIRGFAAREMSPKWAVLAGDIPSSFQYPEFAAQVDGLDYSNAQHSTPPARELLASMRNAAEKLLGGPPDIWHIHNHSLGKNCSLPGIVSLLTESGDRLFLHMHDFCEDGRPENYLLNQEIKEFRGQIYPDADTVHYGFINNRDRDIFLKSDFPEKRAHYMGNPVDAGELPNSSELQREILGKLNARRLFLYPVRAVRRKNFGEMLLWSAVAQDGDVFAATLGPTNKNFIAEYERWRTFAGALNLPVRFEIGQRYDWPFAEIVGTADFIITTSIAEGFGLAFLEPILFGKCILGRDLPEITSDFKDLGLPLDQLYGCLPIPADWIDMDTLKSEISRELKCSYDAYGTSVAPDAVDRAMSSITPMEGYVDFGGLNEEYQRSIIRKIVNDPVCMDQMPINQLVPTEVNAGGKVSMDQFKPEYYCINLLDTYHSILSSRPDAHGYFDPNKVLKQFLLPERFRLLRT